MKDFENKSIHKFALIIIKNEQAQFLLKYDERWGCYLFPYVKITGTVDICLKNYCNNTFGIKEPIILNHTEDDIEKYSVSAGLIKHYHHDFYQIYHKDININNKSLKWFSINDMKNDKNIFNKNSETIHYVECHF